MLGRTTFFFTERGLRTARLDAEILLAHALGIERITLYTDSERPLLPAELDLARGLVARRAAREPIAYITGTRSFRHLTLRVSPDVLVPRPETEHLVEWGIELAPEGASILDWGTGSGAVALAIASERPDVSVTAIDRSHAALAIARGNDDLGRVDFIESDSFQALAGRRFDLILANPPYLSDSELADTPETELSFEPAGALVAGPTGFEAINEIIATAPHHLSTDGSLVLEVGDGQAGAARERMLAAGYRDVAGRPDLAGALRNVAGRAP